MTHYQLVTSNKRKSWIVIIGFISFIVALTYLFSIGFGYDQSLLFPVLLISVGSSFFSYFFSDKIILGISGAREANREEFFDFYTVAENIATSQDLPMPKLYVIEDTAMNAFATGRDPNHAVICATTGLLQQLKRSEVEAVVAHELSHVKNYDIRLMSLVTILVGFIALLSDMMIRSRLWGGKKRDNDNSGQLGMILMVISIILALLSPLIAQLMQLAISRKREFLADASAISMTKNPQGLINALSKISSDPRELEAANTATAHLYISTPFKEKSGKTHWFSKLFMTHPPVAERIAALEKIAQ